MSRRMLVLDSSFACASASPNQLRVSLNIIRKRLTLDILPTVIDAIFEPGGRLNWGRSDSRAPAGRSGRLRARAVRRLDWAMHRVSSSVLYGRFMPFFSAPLWSRHYNGA